MAPDLPSTGSSTIGLRSLSDYRVLEDRCIVIFHYYLTVPGTGKLPPLDVVAVSQAPSLESNPDSFHVPVPMVTMEGACSTLVEQTFERDFAPVGGAFWCF